MSVESVLCNRRGLIVAPAGCGKTHLITDSLANGQEKPYLVLTHTTAGVAALKQRLKRLNVPKSNYIISTVDGWARQIAMKFPMSCDIRTNPDNPRYFYPELRTKVREYIDTGNISEIISASYSRLLVDEYQDCDIDQHTLICAISELLPTIVFGDPLQCIFNFGQPMPSWNEDVQSHFPLIGELNKPWRWINAGSNELGEWILDCRALLQQDRQIDLSSCPTYVNWVQLQGDQQTDNRNRTRMQYEIRRNGDSDDSLLVIGDSVNARSRHKFASLVNGVEVVEPVDLQDITRLASLIDNSAGELLANNLLDAMAAMMTGVGKSNILRRMPAIMAGRNRTEATPIELAVKRVIESGDRPSVLTILNLLETNTDTKIFRKSAYSALKSAVSLCVSDPNKSTKQAAEIIREQRRHQGDRRIPSLAIGSTLLLKGLEADHTMILDAGGMDPNNLYVALSRGAKSITAFSTENVLP